MVLKNNNGNNLGTIESSNLGTIEIFLNFQYWSTERLKKINERLKINKSE